MHFLLTFQEVMVISKIRNQLFLTFHQGAGGSYVDRSSSR
jgi:hypothetical protein